MGISVVNKLFVIRHGESLEDVDKTAYERIADEDMPLTDNGRMQAKSVGYELGRNLKEAHRKIHLILSPSQRVLETGAEIIAGLPSGVEWSLSTNPLIAKQDWGEVTIHNRSEIEIARYRTGVLRYTFPGGESGADLLTRFNSFAYRLTQTIAQAPDDSFLVVTHGFELRVLLKCLLEWSEEYFESLAHPHHCEMKRLDYSEGAFRLLDDMRLHDPLKNPNFIRRG